MNRSRLVVLLLCAGAVALTSSVTLRGATQQASCTFKTLAITPPNSESVVPEGIDRDGTIVGIIEEQSGGIRGFIQPPGGQLQVYQAPNASNTWIMRRSGGVNVGYYTVQGTFSTEGFIATKATFQSVMVPGSIVTSLYSINRSGVVVGAYTDAHGRQHGLRVDHGVFKRLDPPGAMWAEARGINDEGTIVGTFSTNANTGVLKGFTYRAGVYRTMKFPGAEDTLLSDINDNAVIIGVGMTEDADTAFMYEHSTFQTVMDGGYEVLASGLDAVHEEIVGEAGGKPVLASCR